jgi:preprotein translocase subunit SecB
MQLIPLSQIQLRSHWFTNISVRTNQAGKPDGAITLDPVISFDKNPQNANQWMLALQIIVKSNDAQKPFLYEADIAIQGIVELGEQFKAETRDQLAVVNGLSILYSAIREMLLTTTARSGPGIMSLPTLNFIEIVASMKEAEKLKPKVQVIVQPTGNTTDTADVRPSQK